MSEQEVTEYRKQLNGIKVRGKEPQKPIKNWNQCGLSGRVLDVIRKSGFDSPMPIQAQALPVIMSGRDCIGIAETGSGKTLAFVLPMLRHIKDQPPVQQVFPRSHSQLPCQKPASCCADTAADHCWTQS